jgi:hypothetical protein
MKKTALVCSLILAMAIAVTAAAPDNDRDRTASRDVNGVLVGAFAFDMFYPYGPYDFISLGDATGSLKHLGLVKLFTTHQPDPSGDGTLINTEFRIVTADGDEIWGTYSDNKVTLAGATVTAWPNYYYYDGKATFEISGGTGRFAHARGRINATFFEKIEVFDEYWFEYNCSVAWALDGKIRY